MTVQEVDDSKELRAGAGPLIGPKFPESLRELEGMEGLEGGVVGEEVGMSAEEVFREAVLEAGDRGEGWNRRVLRAWWMERGIWLDL